MYRAPTGRMSFIWITLAPDRTGAVTEVYGAPGPGANEAGPATGRRVSHLFRDPDLIVSKDNPVASIRRGIDRRQVALRQRCCDSAPWHRPDYLAWRQRLLFSQIRPDQVQRLEIIVVQRHIPVSNAREPIKYVQMMRVQDFVVPQVAFLSFHSLVQAKIGPGGVVDG